MARRRSIRGERMPLFRQIIAVLISLINIGRSIADPDPRVISYKDKSNAVIFSDIGVTYFSQLLFDVTREQLLVGARDRIYRLTIDGLQMLETATWPADPEKITSCLEKGQSETDCRNYVKVLLAHGNQLFVCGTHAFSPKCSYREMDNVMRVTKWTNGLGMCPYSPHANMTSLMSEKGEYFAGTTMDFAGTDSAIIKDIGRTVIRTNPYNAKWLNDPQFVGSFETDAYVYFLFREGAVEYMNCGKNIYSRIARVCKNDAGGQMILRDNWTTFVKARLNCSLPGEYPFYLDEIQGVTFLPDDGVVYATFTTPKNSIAGSAICSFSLKTIEVAFNGPYKHQESIGSTWERASNYQTQKQCQSSNLLDSAKYQLMDSAVQPISQTPLYYAQLETMVHIAVDVIATKLDREMYILYVSTSENVIKKISVLPRTMKTCVLEIWKPLPDDSNKILSMHFLKQTESLYIGTEAEIIRMPAQHCKRHTTKRACMEAMDPYCGWNELKLVCSPPPDKNPLTPYWHQQVIDCPTFTHPVPGGWSEWSAWTPCNQANTNSESVDKCMCSSRLCNNPAPQNGGAYCEGVSIQVTNCTLHGSWTNWSEWSACSESCGIAVKTRKRSCSNPAPAFGGRVCVGSDTDTTSCLGNPPCPEPILPVVDGAWTEWSLWSECSAKCGTGFRNRSRTCENPPPQQPDGRDCLGTPIEYELCNTQPCLELKRLSDWTPWVATGNTSEKRFKFVCKAPVGDQKLIRIILAKEENRTCESYGQCYYPSGSMEADDSSWSEWSPCSAECGGGEQYRVKSCESRYQDCSLSPKQMKRCNTHACKGEWGCWTDWSSCSVTCGVGVRQRTRVCLSMNNRSVESVGCDGSSISQERCEMPACVDAGEGWLRWSAWSECDESSRQFRKRVCSVRTPVGAQCQGADTETRICYLNTETNDVNPLGIQSGQTGEPPSTAALVLFCFVSFIVGLCAAAVFSYYWTKRNPYTVPSSPHYISKQNPYVTVPLKEVSTLPKRTPSFTKSTLTTNGTLPKVLAKTSSTGVGSTGDYETATIKRNSHSLLNGHHARSSTLDQERFF